MPRTKNSAQSAPAKKKNIPEKSVEASLWKSRLILVKQQENQTLTQMQTLLLSKMGT